MRIDIWLALLAIAVITFAVWLSLPSNAYANFACALIVGLCGYCAIQLARRSK
jgi:hypothetical protein